MTRFPFSRFALPAMVLWTACMCGGAYGQMNVSWVDEFVAPNTPPYVGPGIDRVSVAPDGIYVVGGTQGALPGQTQIWFQDGFVRKYDFKGSELWTRQFAPSNCPSNNKCFVNIAASATVDGLYIAGNTSGNGSLGPSFIRKYDPSGNELWTWTFPLGEEAADVSATDTGVWVAGRLQTAQGSRAIMRGFSPTGTPMLLYQFGLNCTRACDANGGVG